MAEQTKIKAAFLTYNQIGNGQYQTGWHERKGHVAFIGQNSKGKGWAANPPNMPYRERGYYGKDADQELRNEAPGLFQSIDAFAKQLDKIVIYVGAKGSEAMIEESRNLPAEKVTYVLCDCNFEDKLNLIKRSGVQNAKQIRCECGGHRTMESLLENFLDNGEI